MLTEQLKEGLENDVDAVYNCIEDLTDLLNSIPAEDTLEAYAVIKPWGLKQSLVLLQAVLENIELAKHVPK